MGSSGHDPPGRTLHARQDTLKHAAVVAYSSLRRTFLSHSRTRTRSSPS